MSFQLILTYLYFLSLFSMLNSKFIPSSILSLDTFSINAKCVLPMLGQTLAEFQINKNSYVLGIVDIAKNFELYGIPNNSETNPDHIKNINMIYRSDLNKLGMFWQNTKEEVFVTPPAHNDVMEFVSPCAIWMKDLIQISDDFERSSTTPMIKDEAKFANKKYSYKDIRAEVEYCYLFQDENLSALTQIRHSSGLLDNIIAFVESSRSMEIENMTKIPEGINYDSI